MEELVETASELLERLVPEQTRYKVRERPDVRTIRYYVSQGLLPKPLDYEGGRARYGGAHLARLIRVKQLQAEHQPLRRIKTELARVVDEQLVALLRRSLSEGDQGAASAPTTVDSLATGEPADETERLRTLDLSPGGQLSIPREVLGNLQQRRLLADNLESLAQWLRAVDAAPEPGRKGDRK